MKKGLRAGLIVGAVVAAIWLVSAIGFTLARTDCLRPLTERCNNGLMEAYGDFVQLGWVERYQTLISGCLALLAGSFVYGAARFQVAAAERRDKAEQRQRTLNSLSLIRTEFIRMRELLVRKVPYYGGQTFEGYDTTYARQQLVGFDHRNAVLSEFISNALNDVDAGFLDLKESRSVMGGGTSKPRALAEALAMVFYLRNPEEIVDDSGVWNGLRRSRETMAKILLNYMRKQDDLGSSRYLFE